MQIENVCKSEYVSDFNNSVEQNVVKTIKLF